MKKYLLGIDNGGTYSKAALFDFDGNQIRKAFVKIPVYAPQEGFTQRSLEEIRIANDKIIRELVSECEGEIVSIGVTGHGKGLYLLGKDKEFLYSGIGSTDKRALKYEVEWGNDGTSQKVYEKTAQKVIACQPVALLRWLKDHERDVYDQIGYILSIKDFIRYCLTGEIFAEYTDLSGTNLLNLKTKQYDKELLQIFGIDEMQDKLPEIRKSCEVAGRISKEAAKRTGLEEGIPVVGGMFDIDASALAMGNIHLMDMCVIAGTWGINEYVSSELIGNGEISMNSIFCEPQYYLAEESSATSAGNLEWIAELFAQSSYDEINKMVESVPSTGKLYYMPFLYASNENPLAKGMFIGLDGSHTRAHILRAVYEGVVFAHYTHIRTLLKNRPTPEVIRLAGGVVNSDVWSQMFADVFGLPIMLIRAEELGAKGAAMAAGIGAGVYQNYQDAVNHCVHSGKILYPNLEQTEIYQKKYSHYREILDALDSVWEKIED